MDHNFEDVMAKHSDAELLKIVTGSETDYQPLALDAARREFAKRNLSAERLETIRVEIQHHQKQDDDKANQALGVAWKIMTFMFPGLIQIIFSGIFKADGYNRKAKELVRWTLYGFSFYVLLCILILLLDAMA